MTQLRDFALMLLTALVAAWAWFAQVGVSIPPTVSNITNPQMSWTMVTTGTQNNASTTLTPITGLSFNLEAGKKYAGVAVIHCQDSLAIDGIKFDWQGGTAVETLFWDTLQLDAGGAVVLGVTLGNALNVALNLTTLTGESIVRMEFSITVQTAGTFSPRFAQNLHTLGTASILPGSYVVLSEAQP